MNIVAILQARMNSTRLPGKVMLPLAGKPMLQNIVERVQRATHLHSVVVAVPAHDAEAMKGVQGEVYFYEGQENDLVGRYLACAEACKADLIVRVPCDNPCVDPAYIDQAVTTYLNFPKVFFTNTTALCAGAWLDGIGCEVFSLYRLGWLDGLTTGITLWREHPHKYFYDAGLAKDNANAVRLDVNTLDDYHFIEKIYNHFGHNRFTAAEILACPPVQERVHGRG